MDGAGKAGEKSLQSARSPPSHQNTHKLTRVYSSHTAKALTKIAQGTYFWEKKKNSFAVFI